MLILALAAGCATRVSTNIPGWVSKTPQPCDPIAVVVRDLTGGEGHKNFTAFYLRGEFRKKGHDAVLPEEIGILRSDDIEESLKSAGIDCLFTVEILAYGQKELEVMTPTASPFGSSQYIGLSEPSSGYESQVGAYERTKTAYKRVAFRGELKSLKTGQVFFRGETVNRPLVVGSFALYKLYNRRLKLQEMAKDALDELVDKVPIKLSEKPEKGSAPQTP